MVDPQSWDREVAAELLAANAGLCDPVAAEGGSWAVVTEFPLSAWTAEEVLADGGSAADAFVAAAAVDCVLTPGASSFGGRLDAVVRYGPSGAAASLDATFNALLHDPGDADELGVDGMTACGRGVLVPGLMLGLRLLWEKYGLRRWEEDLAPAIWLAERGFPLYPRFAELLRQRPDRILRSAEGRAIFLRDGRLPAAGEVFRQPQLAETLHLLADGGPAALYAGAWADELVETVQRDGGTLTADDIASYHAEWRPLVRGSYLGHELLVQPPPCTGGAHVVAALGVAEALDIHRRAARHHDALTTADEIAAYVSAFGDALLIDLATAADDQRDAFEELLSSAHAQQIAGEIRSGQRPRVRHDPPVGSHSIAVVDADGTIVAGTHSISWTAWGAGLFVGGMALNVAGYQVFNRRPEPGGRLSEVYASMLTHGRRGWYGTASNSAGTLPAQLQAAIDHLGRDIPLTDVTQQPRWGEPAGRAEFPLETTFPPTHVAELAALGIPADRIDGVGAGHLCAAGTQDGRAVAVGNPRWRGAAMAR